MCDTDADRALRGIMRIPRNPDKVAWKNGPLGKGKQADAFRKGYTDAMDMVHQQIDWNRGM